ncbi:hypothetical protein DSO57_1000771 [Entomophthora muscae]|uniref:Uncharacterized protein n=1 Tax=Entomophthora muscae TaxID=34485 RepID=A0ACC2T9E7_9FUNG|nr:hypothetical protein DSO57_1000771 [Entomophthora muscae]
MYLLNNLPKKANEFLSLEFLPSIIVSEIVQEEEVPPPNLGGLNEFSTHYDFFLLLKYAPKRTSWLLAGMFLMGLNVYFPQLSPALSLWTLV